MTIATKRFLIAAALIVPAAPTMALADVFIVDHPTNSDVVDLYNNAGAPVNAGDPTFVSLTFATGVTVGPDGLVYVDTANPTQLGNPGSGPDGSVFSYGYNPVTGQPTSTNLFVQYDGTPTSVFNPQGMKFGPDGNLYIADEGNNGVVHQYDSTGNSVTTYSPAGNPTAVAFSPSGILYAANSQGIDELDPITKTFSTIIQAGGTGEPEDPEDVTFGPDGKIYVLDDNQANPLIFQYNADGSDQSTFVDFSTSIQPDFQPANFAFGPDGLLYVTGQNLDSGVGEVLRYNSNGSFDDVFISGLANPGFLAFTSVPEPTGLTALAGILFLSRRRRS